MKITLMNLNNHYRNKKTTEKTRAQMIKIVKVKMNVEEILLTKIND